MEKIVIETTMKKLPEKCTNCKFSSTFTTTADNGAPYTVRVCEPCKKKLEKVFVEERNNWTYLIPDWCPLAVYEVEEQK